MNINLTAIIVTALICMTALEVFAIYMGINGSVLATVIGVFGVILGACAKQIYDVTKKT